MRHLLLIALCLITLPTLAQTDGGQVELPLSVYNQLVESTRDPLTTPRPAPAAFAFGGARVQVEVSEAGSAKVTIDLKVDVLEDGWVLIPVLPAGTAIESARVGGKEAQLVATPKGLSWAVDKKGSYAMQLLYRRDAQRSETGYSLALAVPEAAGLALDATLPGQGHDVAVIPGAATRTRTEGNTTKVTATLPATRGFQLSWRLPAKQEHVLSRARYVGQLRGSAVRWQAELTVDLATDGAVGLPLLPQSVALEDVRVDGKSATIFLEGDRFATQVRGRGRHNVSVVFEVPVVSKDGPPRVELQIPRVPVSRVELTLPGKKEVTVQPAANVSSRQRDSTTIATAHVPLTSRVGISWAEAVPEEVRTEVRSNAGIYHALRAEEGVLYVSARIDYEITRGEAHRLGFEVPAGVQVERVVGQGGAVADWRLGEARDGVREVSVFLNRQLQGRLQLEISFDRSLQGEAIEAPLVRSLDAQRQRGMVALLAGPDLTLEPVEEAEGLTRVGENQLPPFVREALDLAVAHTFKYVESAPRLSVTAVEPEREPWRFDARIDTLISLDEVTLKGTASVEIDVKSGSILALELSLPEEVSLLSLTGPSLRQHRLEDQTVTVDFTQEMEGRFRLDLAYERILSGDATIEVPLVAVQGSEVDQGRIAVEALSAVEVQPVTVERLTSLDVGELPRQLVLQTTNPILLAYKYVGRPNLGLGVTRHDMVEVHEAAIDHAQYRTLFTSDGLAVTRARYTVRNSSRQFLHLELAKGSKVWGAWVDGRPEKPARAGEGSELILVKIIHSTQAFPVEVVYETPSRAVRGLGRIRGLLPKPEILVTRTRWDVFVPEGVDYREATGNMKLVQAPRRVKAAELEEQVGELATVGGGAQMDPLELDVPRAGLHLAFEKLYANQAGREASFELPYVSGFGRTLGRLGVLLSASAFWVGVAFVTRRNVRLGAGLAAAGTLLMTVLVGHYQLGAGPAWWLSMLLLGGLGAVYGWRFWQERMRL